MTLSMRFRFCYLVAAAALAFAGSSNPSAYAWNRGAMLSPVRVVIEGRDRAAVVKLVNPDDQTNRYKISLVAVRMDEFGNRHHVETPTAEEAAVIKMIRFSPRRVTLGPRGWQTIRIMARKPAGLAPGEYRAHLKVVPIPPNQTAKGQNASDEKGKEGVGVNLNLLFSITIPVIIRHGEGSVALTPEQPRLLSQPDQKIVLETPLVRTGNFSALFDISAFSLANGSRRKIGELKNTSVYTPNTRVRLPIPVDKALVQGLTPGTPIEVEIFDKEKRKAPVSGTWQFVLD